MRIKSIAALVLLALAASGLAMRIARAQATGSLCCDSASGTCVAVSAATCPNPSAGPQVAFAGTTMGEVAVQVQTTEPPTGFTGACLLPFLTYEPQLPTVCYSPTSSTGSVIYGAGATTQLVVPAKTVWLASMWTLPPEHDSFQPVMTCYPHNKDGTCPAPSQALSMSCCDVPMPMSCTDGVFAHGGRALPPSWDGYFARGNVNFSVQ
jgi:hypothetical protein